ncbi:MAG: hypothetical protein EP346_06945 [Bacteroidetes bacterium]|nr:MAG: hypothetical protein EP346_06945 [Bacteroidota bacterium]
MRFELIRDYNKENTLGILICWAWMTGAMDTVWRTVELPWKDNKKGESCIEEGEYELHVHNSPTFGRCLWIKTVSGDTTLPGGRTEILLHPANFSYQLLGCIAPGLRHRDLDKDNLTDVTSSRKAMGQILDMFDNIGVTCAEFTIHSRSGVPNTTQA